MVELKLKRKKRKLCNVAEIYIDDNNRICVKLLDKSGYAIRAEYIAVPVMSHTVPISEFLCG